MPRSQLCLALLIVCVDAHACLENSKEDVLVASVTLTDGGGEIIRDAINSVVDWVDKCIVLDTGVKDNTLEIAKEAAGDKLVIKSYPWPGSFADARNAALDAAHEVGAQWAVILDTDERIRHDPNVVDLRDYLKTTSAAVIDMEHESMTYHKPRFFRMPRPGSFKGPTHEWFSIVPGTAEEHIDTSAFFAELGKGSEELLFKARRDIDILTKETARDPSDQRWWYYLGDAYENAGDPASAIKAWNTCGGMMHGWDEEGAWCMYRASLLHAKNEDWDKALEALSRGMTRHPGLPELPWYAGWVSYQAGRYKQAKAWSHMSIALGCYKGLCVDRIGFSHPPGKYEGPYDVLKWALQQLGDDEGAAQAQADMEKALQMRHAEKTPAAQ